MNCTRVQKEITNSFVVGDCVYSSEVSGHLKACASCREFYGLQQILFRSLEDGLRAIANHPVPAAFLPRVQSGLEKAASEQHSRNPDWRLALLAAAAVLALGLFAVWHRLEQPAVLPGIAEQAPMPTGHPSFAKPSLANPPSSAPSRPHERRKTPKAFVPSHDSSPEVIVLTEERLAFAKFVAQLPQERDVALALTNPAPPARDIPVEVALLEIKQLHLPPLEPAEVE